jgi:hypothetical protein
VNKFKNVKKNIYPILSSIFGAIVFGVLGFLKLTLYGGNSCDVFGKNCDCFCCNLFGLRGYESCGELGFLLGIAVGAATGLIIYKLIKK